jgi:hypothetical protein
VKMGFSSTKSTNWKFSKTHSLNIVNKSLEVVSSVGTVAAIDFRKNIQYTNDKIDEYHDRRHQHIGLTHAGKDLIAPFSLKELSHLITCQRNQLHTVSDQDTGCLIFSTYDSHSYIIIFQSGEYMIAAMNSFEERYLLQESERILRMALIITNSLLII